MKTSKHIGVRSNQRGVTKREINLVTTFCRPDYRGRYFCNRKTCAEIDRELDRAIALLQEQIKQEKGKTH